MQNRKKSLANFAAPPPADFSISSGMLTDLVRDCCQGVPRKFRGLCRAQRFRYHRIAIQIARIQEELRMGISVGSPAPEFTLKDQSQKEVKLSDYKGKNVVIVFYPLDWSPVCTNEHACFVNDMKRFEQLNAQVLGISVDSAWSHKAFAEKMGIHYPLLADFQPRGAVGEKFGVFLADKGITGRAIVVVDRNGKLAWFKNYDIPTVPDIKEVADALAKLN
jgi:mycoredoxin-dependent peroxiredoxin